MPTWRDTVFSDFQPFAGGRSITMAFAQDGARIERPILVPWSNISQAKLDILGFSEVKTSPGGAKYISRTIPHAYEGETDTTGLPWLYADYVGRVEALGANGKKARGDPNFKQALMTVVYTSRTYSIFDDQNPGVVADDGPLVGLPDEATLIRYVSKFYHPSNRVVTVPQALLSWVQEGTDPAGKIMEGIGKLEPGAELQYVHHLRPDLPKVTLGLAAGKVNDAEFDGYAAGTLLCLDPQVTPVTLPVGERAYDITFRFRYLPKYDTANVARGHNAFLRCWTVGGVGGTTYIDYRRVNTKGDGTGENVYRTFDFKKLFRPDQ